jgi:hypothetical protein
VSDDISIIGGCKRHWCWALNRTHGGAEKIIFLNSGQATISTKYFPCFFSLWCKFLIGDGDIDEDVSYRIKADQLKVTSNF